MSEALNKIKEFKLSTLTDLYNQLKPEQQDLFCRLYIGGIEKIEESKIDWAIQQCERTIIKNNS